jgi:catechol-2,3-dioxygenase
MPKWVHHFAFDVDTIDEVRAIKERLEQAGIEVLGVTDHHFLQSIYFFDPNGLRLEVTTRTETEEYINAAKQKAHAALAEWSATKRASVT